MVTTYRHIRKTLTLIEGVSATGEKYCNKIIVDRADTELEWQRLLDKEYYGVDSCSGKTLENTAYIVLLFKRVC